MSQIKGENYFQSIPIPTDEEGFELGLKLEFPNQEDGPALEFIFEQLLVMSPDLQRYIEFDIRQARYEQSDMDGVQLDELGAGIWAGYRFFVGAITFVHFQRSGYDDIFTYLDDAPNRMGEIIHIGPREKQRLRNVRLGKATLDVASYQTMDDSRGLAYEDAGSYFFDAVPLETVMHAEEHRIRQRFGIEQRDLQSHPTFVHEMVSGSTEAEAYIHGFRHGISQAIEMYLQVAEEQLLERLEHRL